MKRFYVNLTAVVVLVVVAASAVSGTTAIARKADAKVNNKLSLIIIDPGHGGLTNTIKV